MSQSKQLSAPKRLVIIGSRGFVGSHLAIRARYLKWPVLELSSADLDLTSERSSAVICDKVQKDDSVVFISALTPDKGRDRATLIRNIAMVDNVCQALESSKCKHLTYISSDAVYSDSDHLIRETSACNPASYHGVMHLVRERMLQEMAKQTGIPLLILRPCAVYGFGDTHNSYGPNRFVRSALTEREIKISGEGEEQRDHLFIEDLVGSICQLASQEFGGILNLASGQSISFGEVSQIVAKMVGADVRISKQPRQSPISHRHFDVTARIAAMPKMQFTSISAGLTQMLNSQRSV